MTCSGCYLYFNGDLVNITTGSAFTVLGSSPVLGNGFGMYAGVSGLSLGTAAWWMTTGSYGTCTTGCQELNPCSGDYRTVFQADSILFGVMTGLTGSFKMYDQNNTLMISKNIDYNHQWIEFGYIHTGIQPETLHCGSGITRKFNVTLYTTGQNNGATWSGTTTLLCSGCS